MNYPEAKKVDQKDDYKGLVVEDPYRWLEDTDSAETKTWVEKENELTASFLEKIPQRQEIKERLTKLWNYERYGAPDHVADRYFYFKNDGLQNQAVLYVTASLDDPGKVLLDPNTLSADGTVALGGYAFSEDARFMAYGLAKSGSDWTEWKVRDVATGKDLEDKLEWIKFSGVSWKKDGSGFFYSRYDEPREGKESNYFQKLFWHKLGTRQSDDTLIYKRDDEKEWGFGAEVTEDGRYLIISVWKGTDPKNQVFYQDLTAGGPVVELFRGFERGWDFLENEGTTFFFKTDLDAPRGRIVKVDLAKPEALAEVVPQAEETIESVHAVGGRLLIAYLKDAHTVVRVFDLDGKRLGDVALPGIGSASGFGGKKTDKETFYAYTSYTAPTTIYRYDVANNVSTVWKRPKVDFDPDAYESRQVFVPSKDGTKVPLTIASKKGVKLDGKNRLILYGYGGFNVSLTPYFSVETLAWLERGGVYAVANLRGGGEYGEPWHKAGTRHRKQNVFDDFVACAEWLVANDWTSRSRLAIEGASNGGLLVGACLTQRPDLFGAALPDVGVMDMLRFQKFTIGWAWVDDYGSSDDPEDAKVLRAYSPYHNVKAGTHYPPTMITTADHDDRVVPGHSFKFAAALQAAQGGEAPILARIETKAGHGAGLPLTKAIEKIADQLAFLEAVLR
ncbi:MAG TPA: prolyl oligopeptidase family serine peptidase [Planctomycetota bacterium]|nr:prolyl oligopeptidase family serine peptidase [Planctomycetota bacterium]